MKKLIAISVMLALVTGAVFAQTAVSGALEARWFIIMDDTIGDDTPPATNATLDTAYVQLRTTSDDGKVGGLVRVRQQDTGYHRVFLFWRPIPELRIFMGRDADGQFSTGDALTDWQFHQGSEGTNARHNWAFWRSVFPGNWDSLGLAVSYYGVENLTLNLVLPVGTAPELANLYPFGLQLSANYRIPDIGTAFFSYVGSGKSFEQIDDPYEKAGFGRIGISFMLTAIQGLRAQLGLSFDPAIHGPAVPWRIGFGLHWNSGNFGIKTRGAICFNTDGTGEDIGPAVKDGGVYWTFNIMPHYTLKNTSFYCDFVFDMNTKNEYLSWFITPYVRYRSFRAGLWIQGDTRENSKVMYRIPVRVELSF